MRTAARNLVPKHIADLETALETAPLHSSGTVELLRDYISVFSQHAIQLEKFHGSREVRSRRFTRTSRRQRLFARIVRDVCPDPEGIVVWGAGFNGRAPRKGDTRGNNCVKGLRRLLARHRVVVLVNEWGACLPVTQRQCLCVVA